MLVARRPVDRVPRRRLGQDVRPEPGGAAVAERLGYANASPLLLEQQRVAPGQFLRQWHGLAAACGVDLPRIAFGFNRRDYGRLRQFIDVLNSF